MTNWPWLLLALAFLLLAPYNIRIAVRVFRKAIVRPWLPLLVLLSRLVVILTLVSVTLALAAFNAIVVLAGGDRPIPMVVTGSAITIAALIASVANRLVEVYLNDLVKQESE